jgi:acyl-CoA reductase-like NAD-dependent aldehyde dehydrogenase
MTAYHLLIDGDLVPGDLTMPVINPATEAVVDMSPRASLAQLDRAVTAAEMAFNAWATEPLSRRKQVLLNIAEAIVANIEKLAVLVTLEQGKPLVEARREVMGMAGFFRFSASLELPITPIADSAGRKVDALRRPLGPVAAIIPWNFPLLTIAFKVPSALLAGNTVIIKPAPTTPLSTLLFGELIVNLVPRGVINIIADANDLGAPLASHPRIRKVSFTGSTATGQNVMRNAADTLKRLTLELGGNDAAIVLGDTSPQAIAPAIFRAAFHNNGQVCLAIKRLYVHESIYDSLCDELAAIAEKTVVGDGMEADTVLGPVQNKAQYDKIRLLIEEARKQGKIIAGGTGLNRPGYFVRPTIVRDIVEGARLVDEEQFGPILPLIKFSDIDEVIQRANATNFGLGASVWSTDAAQANDIARRLEAGTVWINKHADLAPHIPFGGSKYSGLGTEFAQEGLYEFTQLQIINGHTSEYGTA